jgi:thioredoxin-related protein
MFRHSLEQPIELTPGRPTAPTLTLLMLVAVFLLQTCTSKPSEELQQQDQANSEAGISWFEGDVDEAFALASTEGKPVFLYWGAEWCPPCHYLKDKLFTRPEFIARMEDFVPVYLDGDTERAQIWGEKLAVMGYPTVIVFSPAGDEVMRMPSTLPVDRYQEVLDAAMASTRPVRIVLEEVMASGPASADKSDLAILAYYSWSQDSSVELTAKEKMSTFRRLYDETPDAIAVERSRFLTHYLIAATDMQRQSANSEDAPGIAIEDLPTLREESVRILSDSDLRSANLVWVLYYSTDTIGLLAPSGSREESDLISSWTAALVDIENDSTLALNDRLSALRTQIALAELAAKAESGAANDEAWEAPEDLKDRVRERVAWALDETTAESELQTALNTMAYLLASVGLEDEAEGMLAARMNDTVAPYYFMTWIGSLKQEAGETEEALVWYRRAYESSTGRYSRFRWGTIYLRQLLELAPDEIPTIESHSKEVLAELLALDDAFAGGNQSRLEGLERSYLEWSEPGEREAALASLRDYVHSACESFPSEGEDSQAARCSSFLAEAAPPAQEAT